MRAALVGLVACVLVALGCSGNKLTANDESDLAQYAAQQAACITAYGPVGQAAVDICRANIKKVWDAKWNQEFDGGFGEAAGSQ